MDQLTEADILSAFDDPCEEIPVPDLASIDFDALEYLGWVHPSGQTGYVVVLSPEDARLKGVVLRRNRFTNRVPGFEMCSLCHHVHQPNGTAMFTMTRRDAQRHHAIGNIVCKDLDCSLRIRNLVGPQSYVNETLYLEAKIWRMQLALHKWLKAADRL